MTAPIHIPPAIASYCAGLLRKWQLATDRCEAKSKEYAEAETERLKSERDLREAAKAVALVLANASGNVPTTGAGVVNPSPSGEAPASDVVLAWMQAGSPVDGQGNMIVPGHPQYGGG